MTGIEDILNLAGQYWISLAVVFLRVGAIVAFLPAFGERMIPVRIRLAAAIAFSFVVAPAAAEDILLVRLGPALLVSEIVTGLFLGFVVRLFVFALEIAGAMIAQSTSLSQMFGSAGEPMPAISHLAFIAGLALAASMGLHVYVAEMIIASYRALPPGLAVDLELLRSWGVSQLSGTFLLAFRMAAPFVIGAFLYNLTLGVINRAMPQMAVFFVGAPAITGIALLLLSLAAPMILSMWLSHFHAFLAVPFGGVE